MKLKELLTNVVENKSNGQLTTSLKKNQLKKIGMSTEEFLNIKINTKLKGVLLK